MRRAHLTGLMVAVALACGLAPGADYAADALPLGGKAHAVAPMVHLTAHKPNEWYLSGHWWRPGPWSNHVIHGLVTRRGHPVTFVPWGADRLRYCAAKYRGFDPATWTYVTRSGQRRVCR